jgi:hypothetical protein
MRLATGMVVEFSAGEALPETGLFICNAAGQNLVRGVVAGTKQTFTVVQRLWRLKAGSSELWRTRNIVLPRNDCFNMKWWA